MEHWQWNGHGRGGRQRGGSLIKRTQSGSISVSDATKVYVAYSLSLTGYVSAGAENVIGLSFDGTDVTLLSFPELSGGAATVYVRSDFDTSGTPVVTTTAGSYTLTGGSLVRTYTIGYSDIVDDTNTAPQRSSNASSLNAASFTVLDTTLSLVEPAPLDGYTFAGWTWTGQTATSAATSIDLRNVTGDLDVVAHWTVAQGGAAGGRGGTAGTAAAAGTDAAETTEAAAAPAEATAQATDTRVSRGTSATKVSFSDSSAQDPIFLTAAQGKVDFPWIPVLAGAAVLAGLIIAAVATGRRKRRRNDAE